MAKRVHVYVSGLVQGVGYRYAVTRVADELNVVGWVRNLPDGRVEAEFQGDESSLREMLARCREGPVLSNVQGMEEEWLDPLDDYTDFDVRF